MTTDVLHIDSLQYGPISGFASDTTMFDKIQAGFLWEPDVVDFITRNISSGGFFLDCGANIGLHSIAMALRRPDVNHIYAFEPHPEIFNVLLLNSNRFSNITALPIALSSTARQVSFESAAGASNPAGAVLKDLLAGKLHAQAMKVDDLKFLSPTLMKIDVEGHEWDLIEGARSTIMRHKPILLIELWDNDLDGRTRKEKIEQICALGYNVRQVTEIDYGFFSV